MKKKDSNKPKAVKQEKVVIPTTPVKDKLKSANQNQDRVTAYIKG